MPSSLVNAEKMLQGKLNLHELLGHVVHCYLMNTHFEIIKRVLESHEKETNLL